MTPCEFLWSLLASFVAGLVSGALTAWIAMQYQAFLLIKQGIEFTVRYFPGTPSAPSGESPEGCISDLTVFKNQLEDSGHLVAAAILQRTIDDMTAKSKDSAVYEPKSGSAAACWTDLDKHKTEWKKAVWALAPSVLRLIIPKSNDRYTKRAEPPRPAEPSSAGAPEGH